MAEERIDGGIAPYIQPVKGGFTNDFSGAEETVGYLPGTLLRIWYTHLPTAYPSHWHHAIEIIYCTGGHYAVEAEGNVYQVSGKDILFIPSRTIHAVTPMESCNGFVCSFDAAALNGIPSMRAILPVLTAPIFISANVDMKLHIVALELLEHMKAIYFSTEPMRELLIFSDLLRLITAINSARTNSIKTQLHVRPDKQKEYTDIFHSILLYIDEHYAESITIDQVAKQYGFSKYHFVRLFKQYTKFTFCDYLTYKRMKVAEQLLSDPAMSITDIAFLSGFSSLPTFSRVFKAHKNCTPTEYRNAFSKM